MSGKSCQFITYHNRHYKHLTEDILAGNPTVYISNSKEQVREVFEHVKTLQHGRKMVMLHGDAGEIAGYDHIPFPESDAKRKTYIIENFSDLKMLFFLHMHTLQPLVLVFLLIIQNFIKYMHHVQTWVICHMHLYNN